MIRIAGVPVRTRLPSAAWIIAAFLTLCAVAPSLAHLITSGSALRAEARLASMVDPLVAFGSH
jgi:hypothetical protein